MGRVVWHALEHLSWSGCGRRAHPLRRRQRVRRPGPGQAVPRRRPGRRGREGIVVNAIYCGGADDGDAGGLPRARRARRRAASPTSTTTTAPWPSSRRTTRSSPSSPATINRTYVAYGLGAPRRRSRARSPRTRTPTAAGAPAAAERAAAKAGRLYRNSAWDLVDRMDEEDFDLATIRRGRAARGDAGDDAGGAPGLPRGEEGRAREDPDPDPGALTRSATPTSRPRWTSSSSTTREALDRALKDAIREQAAEGGFDFD